MDARVLDWIDDKIATASDFQDLDTLLDSVKTQQDLLKQQLADARREYENGERGAEEHATLLRKKAHAFQKEQANIDIRLLVVTQSETSDEAAEKFQESTNRLGKLEVAAGYVELLGEVDKLSSECVTQLGKSDEAALEPYRKLQKLTFALQPLHQSAEGAAPHLLDHVSGAAQKLRTAIQQHFSDDLEKTMKKMQWPKATSMVPMALQNEWEKNVHRLLDLQRPDLEAREANVMSRSSQEEPPVLLPLEVLMRPLEQRFTYHFSGNRQTNRLDKPEYFLSHAADLILQYSDFVENALQGLLSQHFRGTDLAMTPAYMDATCALITATLPMLQRKLASIAQQVAAQPNLISHLVHEVMAFDTNIQETYGYAPISPSMTWRGLAYYLLDTLGYSKQWLHVEREFALSRYRAIIDDPKAGELDYDSVAADATKPTKAAIRVNDLLETITDRYKPLVSFSQKLKFLIDIQIAIFDQFHVRLHSSLEAYLTMTSTLARTVHGVSREEQSELQGIKGLDRLCRVFGSAEYLERAMRDWSDDVFFLELWQELQDRVNNRDSFSSKLGSLQELQRQTYGAVGNEDGGVQGALFDETAEAYRRLRVRSEGIIVETFAYNVREALRSYTRITSWASLSSSTAGGAVSAELDPLLRVLADYFGFLSRALGKVPMRRVTRQLCFAIQTSIWDSILLRQTFSAAGATQLTADVTAIISAIDQYSDHPLAQRVMVRLIDGARLLGLPIRGEIAVVQDGADDEAAAWDEVDDDDEYTMENETPKQMGLFEAERLVFMDNESARHALERLGLENLSEADARSVLERRVELASSLY
ncbi:hypothetical protein B0A48_06978 [Cryoendolithus antarcticus]|uniref:RINT-1 family protein n=1 Tax=Cryoendolithus antarcticus TaxID=1507870 RepID=A0A1V8TA85_9PEZI|nr:hypothetical protein B0A48_06978 [Cryoendolithus antarcticus]